MQTVFPHTKPAGIIFLKGLVAKSFKITSKPTHIDSMKKAVIPSIY